MSSPYSDEIKASVMAALLEGQSVRAVADKYQVPRSTVGGWRAEARSDIGRVPDTKRERIGDLLIDYLAAALETLQKQVGVFADETWLKRQSASEAAVLHGVLADKTVRLLEALADQSDDEPDLP